MRVSLRKYNSGSCRALTVKTFVGHGPEIVCADKGQGSKLKGVTTLEKVFSLLACVGTVEEKAIQLLDWLSR